MISTNITIVQIKDQLPIFSGQSSITLIDALETYKTHLKKAGIPKQLWGGVLLNKLEGAAYDKIPPKIKREQNFEDMEEILVKYYDNSVQATSAIIKAHRSAGIIPDLHQQPTAALVVLRTHAEIFENARRFLDLTTEENAKTKITSGTNVDELINLLPARVINMEELNRVDTHDEKRTIQYDKIVAWVKKNKDNLLLRGTEIKKDPEQSATLIIHSSEGG